MENWKFVNEKYEISTYGRLRRGDKIMKGNCSDFGYIHYSMCIGNKRIYAMAHRLVALAFIPNPENKAEVNHIDCNPKNNNIENLNWCTRGENIKHSRDLQRYPKTIKKRTAETLLKDKKAKEKIMKPVIDEYGNKYETAKAAAYAHGLTSQAVRLAIKNGYKSANRSWAYLTNN